MDFLEQLYSGVECGYINIWTLQDKGSAWFRHDEPERAMEYALQHAETMDVYFGVNPRCTPVSGKRGAVEDVCAVIALCADIDIRNGVAHKKQVLPKEQADALHFVGELPLPPTFIVDSGNGMHVYWQLTEPMDIVDHNSLAAASALSRGWGQFLCDRARQLHQWELDNVSDLARALRVPGTLNHKSGEPLPVQVFASSGATYNPSDFEVYIQDAFPDAEYLQRQPQRFTLPEKIEDGSRNETLFKLASSLRAKGLSESAIEAALQAENRARCIPPKDEGEVRTIAHSAAKYPPGALVSDIEDPQDDEFIVLPGMPISGLKQPGWNVTMDGVTRERFFRKTFVTERACSHPVLITETYHNLDTQMEKVRLAFCKHGRWHEVLVDCSVIASRQAIIKLADFGIKVNSENAKLLVQYLSDLEDANKDIIPCRQSVSRAGWIGAKLFSPYDEDLTFDGEMSYRDLFQAIRSEGKIEDWISAARAAREDPAVRAVLAASFASPLVALLNKQVFFVHLWGETGTGKSVIMQLAASVWGDPRILTRTLNATPVGLERLAAFHHSLPLCLDEFQTLRKDRVDVDTLLYTLAEGKSKTMGRREGGVAVESRWANIILTNGEEPLTTDRSGGGAKNRAIELYINKPLLQNAPGIADAVQRNFGHAGRIFITATKQYTHENGLGKITNRINDIRSEFTREGTEKQINAISMLATAEYFECRFILGMPESECLAAMYDLAGELSQQASKPEDVDLVGRAWNWVTGWIASNREHFKGGEGSAFYSPIYGRFENGIAYVISSVVNAELEKAGYSVRKCMNGFRERGWLIPYLDGSSTRSQWNLRMEGVTTKCYKLRVDQTVAASSVLGEETQESMPF